MSGSDYITNITTTYTDSNGNALIGSNNILSVYYYDSSVSAESSWRDDWAVVNPVMEGSFSNPVLVSGVWSFETDSTGTPTTSVLGLHAAWNSTDLLDHKTVTASGYTWPYYPSHLVDFDQNGGWRTPDAAGNGAYAATVDMGDEYTVRYVVLSPGFGGPGDVSAAIKDYRIGVSSTGDEDDFTIVATGTTVSGSFSPIPIRITTSTARYVKLYVDSNWGHGSYTNVFKLSAFTDPDWSLFGYHVDGNSGGSYYKAIQEVNLDGVNSLFFDAHAHMTNTYQKGYMSVSVSGIGGSTEDILKEYDWASTGTAWLDDDGTYDGRPRWTRLEEEVDVSSYTGSVALKLNIFNDNYGIDAFYGFFDNIDVVPLWYREGDSSSRGGEKQFPSAVYIVSDAKGVSIIDASDTSLWMRFDVGYGYMLTAPARHVFAKEGRLYLSTSSGLHIIDFVANRCWKFTDSGVYYRMSIGHRNERAYWFTDTTSVSLPTSDVMWSTIVNESGTDLFLVGHSNGMTSIENWLSSSRVLRDSSFNYPVSNICYTPASGVADKVFFVGGKKEESFVGVINTPGVLSTSSFDGVTKLDTDVGLCGRNENIAETWDTFYSDIVINTGSNYVTFSGVKSDYGPSFIYQSSAMSNKPFSVSADVRITKWPERGDGGFYLGVTSGWPLATPRYGVSSHALALAAANGLYGVYVENESFSNYPSRDNWQLTVKNHDNTKVYNDGDAVRIYCYMFDGVGDGYAPGVVFGHLRTLDRSFSAKLKVKCLSLDSSTDSARQAGVIFGITDGQYIPASYGSNGLFISLYSDAAEADPPVYCLASSTSVNYISWDTTTTVGLFSGDLSGSADWHVWEFSYDSSSKTITAAVDSNTLGSKTLSGMADNVGVVFGVVGNVDGYADVLFKDFEIDFGSNSSVAKKKYIVHTYNDGIITRPTISGTHLDGVPFDASDGTSSAEWHRWLLDYTPPVAHAYVDGELVGSTTLAFEDNAPIRIFLGCDHPATQSGTYNDWEVDISVRDLKIDYTQDYIVASGIVNSLWADEGSYLGTDYTSIYLATSSGVVEAAYNDGTTISGVPDLSVLYGVVDSNFGNEVLYGNINNITSVENESGYSGLNGLLYVGSALSSGYYLWDRYVSRPGGTGSTDTGLSIGVSPSHGRVYLYHFDSQHAYLYERPIFVGRGHWSLAAVGNYPDGFDDSPPILSHAACMIDLLDGNMYYFDSVCVGVLSIGRSWVLPDDNIGSGPAAFNLTEQSLCAVIPNRQVWGVEGTDVVFYDPTVYDWSAKVIDSSFIPNYTDTVCAYSDLDNSVYVVVLDDGSFYRISLDYVSVYEELTSCPINVATGSRVSMFYRPYNGSIYVVSASNNGVYFMIYNISLGVWDGFGDSAPFSSDDYTRVSYDVVSDTLYITTGITSTSIYKYRFSSADQRIVRWEVSGDTTPSDITDKYTLRISDGWGGLQSNDFRSGSISGGWFSHGSGSITPTSSGVHFVLPFSSDDRKACVVSSVPALVSDLTIEAYVRISDMCSADGGGATSRNMFLMGLTGYKGAAAFKTTADVGLSVSSINGLFMAAMNDYNEVSHRYTMAAIEDDSTYYNTTEYVNFASTDATVSADFRRWTLEYDHSEQTLTSYIDNTQIGTVTLSGSGFEHGALLSIGAWSEGSAVSGTTDVYVRDLTISSSASSSVVSDYLDINLSDYYDYAYYDKYDSLLSSGTGFSYKASARFVDVATISNYYICSIGEVRDGHKRSMLAALNTTPASVGLYVGGDPSSYTSYVRSDVDWTVRHSYIIEHEGDKVRVYIDSTDTASIEYDYDSLPNASERRVLFGHYNVDTDLFVDSFSRDESKVVSSGTWTRSYDFEGTLNGSCIYSNDDSVDTKVICDVGGGGDQVVYMFYEVEGSNAPSVPVVVYHNGVVDYPTADGYISTSIVSYGDVDEYGNSSSSATTIYVDETRYSNGSSNSDLHEVKLEAPSGWLYLGKYSDVDRIVVTTSGTSTKRVVPGVFKLRYSRSGQQAKGSFRFYSVLYSTCSGYDCLDLSEQSGFCVVDRAVPELLDYYSTNTAPSIVGDNINDFDIV